MYTLHCLQPRLVLHLDNVRAGTASPQDPNPTELLRGELSGKDVFARCLKSRQAILMQQMTSAGRRPLPH